jgi:glycerol uptake facilitator-like aquaporin
VLRADHRRLGLLLRPGDDLPRQALAEALGTGVLTAAVVGSGVMATRLSPGEPGLQLLENTAATAAVLVAIITALGEVSGAHLNPAVTLAARVLGHIPSRAAAVYAAAQVVGACIGAMVANVMFDLAVVDVSGHHRAGTGSAMGEVVATAGLLLIIHGTIRNEATARLVPFTVAAWIAGAYWFTPSTSFANPAVTIGRTLSDTFAGIAPASAALFVGVQLLAALAAVPLIRTLFHHEVAPDAPVRA